MSGDRHFMGRHSFLIYPKFQLTVLAIFSVTITSLCGFIYFQIWSSFNNLAQLGSKVNLPIDHPYFDFLALEKANLMGFILIGMFLGLGLSILATLLITHRMAGPIKRLVTYFIAIKNGGDINPVFFRKNDYFSDLPSEINQAMEKLQSSEDTKKSA
ncbi:MAG: methyl-accepting chemotaxis protein [Bacteriovoracaceae bacterium]|nr:methyl-accepting chemotaxis protein [Bacteriovoracaceae bacterium]